jgi:hypothetical protein
VMTSTLAIAPCLTPVQTPSFAPVLTSPTKAAGTRRLRRDRLRCSERSGQRSNPTRSAHPPHRC